MIEEMPWNESGLRQYIDAMPYPNFAPAASYGVNVEVLTSYGAMTCTYHFPTHHLIFHRSILPSLDIPVARHSHRSTFPTDNTQTCSSSAILSRPNS